MANANKTAGKQRGKPWPKGTSGNPNGRPVGSRNRVTIAAEALLDGEGEAITRKAIELAKAGDLSAIRLCLERFLPPRKDRPIDFKLATDIKDTASAALAMGEIVRGVTTGELTPSEGSELARMVEAYAKVIEVNELEQRLAALEKRAA